MKKNINKIVVSGGNGRFATVLKKTVNSKNYYFPSKSQMNILNPSSLEKYLKMKKPKYENEKEIDTDAAVAARAAASDDTTV